MLTVQEAFKKADTEELLKQYFYDNPVKLTDVNENKTIKQAKQDARDVITGLIDRLRTIEPVKVKEGRNWAFLTSLRMGGDGLDEPNFDLYKISDLKKPTKDIVPYSIIATRHNELASFQIADTYLTQYYLTELLSFILYESSWYGVKQEDLDDLFKRLDEAKHEEGTLIDVDEYFAQYDADLKKIPKFDDQQNDLVKRVYKLQGELADSSLQKEIKEFFK